ncbi:MAG: hypothetical protein GEU79_03660 [Acidimicrobiia bacterium]|nr:hypothetical protein [Acidimicrobiia bacterium]
MDTIDGGEAESVYLMADVHAEFDALAEVGGRGLPIMVLGDLINLIDYRTVEGIIPRVMGREFGSLMADARGRSDFSEMRRLWSEHTAANRTEVGAAMEEEVLEEYRQCGKALEGSSGWVTFGNVDRPRLLADSLPAGVHFVHGQVVELSGVRFGFVGGGTETPMQGRGEVTHDDMVKTLDGLGEVDVLCSHVPPAIPALYHDVVTGRPARHSQPILEYLSDLQPRWSFYGDIHQPRATRWRHGETQCQNVGYFRATKRPLHLDLGTLELIP